MADTLGSDDKEKSLYVTQIRYLDEQLERLQLKCDELEKVNKNLVCLHRALEKDKSDIIEYLKHAVAAKEKEMEELVAQLEQHQQAAERDREALKLQLSQQEQELQEQVDKLNSERIRLEAVLKEQQEQREHLVEQMQQRPDVESLEKQLLCQQEEHEAAMKSLSNEAELQIANIIKEEQRMENSQVKMRISQIWHELGDQRGEKLEKIQLLLNEDEILWEQKNDLQIHCGAVCREMDQLREDISKLNQEVLNNKEVVQQLTKEFQHIEEERESCSFRNERLKEVEDNLRRLMASWSDTCSQKSAEAAQLRAELQKERSRKKQLEDDMQEATDILRHIPADSEKLSGMETQRLLEILKSRAVHGKDSAPEETGPTLSDMTEESSGGQKPQTSTLKPSRADTQNLATDPLFLMSRYRPGDLGLIPRPTWRHKAAFPSGKVCSQRTSSSDLALQQDDSEAGAPPLQTTDPTPVHDKTDLKECSPSQKKP